jgi:hypothetical protein
MRPVAGVVGQLSAPTRGLLAGSVGPDVGAGVVVSFVGVGLLDIGGALRGGAILTSDSFAARG